MNIWFSFLTPAYGIEYRLCRLHSATVMYFIIQAFHIVALHVHQGQVTTTQTCIQKKAETTKLQDSVNFTISVKLITKNNIT